MTDGAAGWLISRTAQTRANVRKLVVRAVVWRVRIN